MGVTISTHNGSSACREHNVRNWKVVSKEDHIDPNGHYEIWHDEKIRDAYTRIFGAALARYNDAQTREDRKITSYYNQVAKSAKQHPCYEMIIGVYDDPDHGVVVSDETKKAILSDFVNSWQERNPNLEMIGAYFHADEPHADLHVHIDYVPVAYGYKRGLDTQAGLVKALEEMGYTKQGPITAQIKWEAEQNDYLTKLCESRGLTVDHPKAQKKHLDTPDLKAKTEKMAVLDQKIDKRRAQLVSMDQKHKVATQELKATLDMKARASEIHKVFGDKEVSTYHKNMLDSTRAIGSEAYKHMREAKQALESAKARESRVEKKEAKINPLYNDAKQANEIAQERLENVNEYIRSEAHKESVQAIRTILAGDSSSRTKRMEEFMQSIRFQDGRSALDVFLENERQLQKRFQSLER